MSNTTNELLDIKYDLTYSNGMITSAQIRMAIALTGIKTVDIAKDAGVSRSTLSNMMSLDIKKKADPEKEYTSPNLSSLEKVRLSVSSVLDKHGFRLTEKGIDAI